MIVAERRLSRNLRHAFRDHLGLKVFSLGAAIALFSIVRGAEDAQRPVYVDLEPLLPASKSGKILVSDLPDKVKITVRGSRSLVNSIDRERLGPLQIDLRDTRRRYYYFDQESVDLPPGVTVVQIQPSSVPLRWANLADRQVPIRARLSGRPAVGFAVTKTPDIVPAVAGIRGPESDLRLLSAVRTEPVDVRGLSAGKHERWVPLEPAPEHMSYIGRPVAVKVVVEIEPLVIEKTYRDVPVTVEGDDPKSPPRGFTATVTLRGPEDTLKALTADELKAYVESGSGDVAPCKVRGLPPGVEVAHVEPPTIALKGRR